MLSPETERSFTRTFREVTLELNPPTASTSSVRGAPVSFSFFATSSRIRVVSLPSSSSTFTVSTAPSSSTASSETTPSATLHSRPRAALNRAPSAGGAVAGGGGASCKREW